MNPWHVEISEDAWLVLERIQEAGGLQLLVLDTAYAERDSLHLLRWLGRVPREFPIIVICQSQDTRTGDEALRLGANQVMIRPLRENELEDAIGRSLDRIKGQMEIEERADIEDDFFLSVSPVMQKIRAQAELLARADVPALIMAEPGSAAESVAHLIHRFSPNSAARFRRLNCATLALQCRDSDMPGGKPQLDWSEETEQVLLEFREPGTILLENIKEMPHAVQLHLLDILDGSKAVATGRGRGKLRILATAGPDIEEVVGSEKLRKDLYSRLSAFTIQIPPLRRRKDEIEVLLRYSMHKLANQFKRSPKEFSRETLEACLSYSWPGNMRELQSFVKRYLFAQTENERPDADEMMLPPAPVAPSTATLAAERPDASASLKAMVQDLTCKAEKSAIAAALQKTHWNRKAAAQLLRVSYRTLLYKIERYQMYDSAAVPSRRDLPQ